MKKTLKRITSICLAIGFCLSFVACATTPSADTSTATSAPADNAAAVTTAPEPTAAPEPIKIGFLAPLSGQSANTGKASLWAAQMMVDIINNQSDVDIMLAADAGLPNMNGAQIELVIGDTKGDTETTTSEAKRLIQEGCVAIAGQFSSATTKTVAVVTEQYGIPLLTAGTSITLTDGSTPYEWLFRLAANDYVYVKNTFDFVKAINDKGFAKIDSIAFMSEDSEFGKNIAAVERNYATENNLTVAEDIIFTPSSTTLSSEVMKLKDSGADAVFIAAAAASDVILFVQTCKNLNYFPQAIIGQRGGFTTQDFLNTLGTDTEYIFTTAGAATDLNKPCLPQLIELYKTYADEGFALNEGVVRDSINVLLVAAAIDQAMSTEPQAIKDALINLQVDMDMLPVTWGGVQLDEFGQNTLANGVVQQIQGGKWTTVFPLDTANAPYIVPAPGWNER